MLSSFAESEILPWRKGNGKEGFSGWTSLKGHSRTLAQATVLTLD
jgi:hypothetical protein